VAGERQHARDGNAAVDDGRLNHAAQAVDVMHVGVEGARIGGTGRIFKGRPGSTPGKNALLFMFAVG
jgi:hypothetical protein